MDREPFDEAEDDEPPRSVGMPSPLMYRGSLAALAAGTLLAVFLFVRPPESESRGEPTRTLATATRAISATATATIESTPGGEPTAAAPAGAASPTAEASPTPGGERSHVVQSGDTLSGIAEQFNTTVEAITALNPGVTAENLEIGSTLRIPAEGAE